MVTGLCPGAVTVGKEFTAGDTVRWLEEEVSLWEKLRRGALPAAAGGVVTEILLERSPRLLPSFRWAEELGS